MVNFKHKGREKFSRGLSRSTLVVCITCSIHPSGLMGLASDICDLIHELPAPAQPRYWGL